MHFYEEHNSPGMWLHGGIWRGTQFRVLESDQIHLQCAPEETAPGRHCCRCSFSSIKHLYECPIILFASLYSSKRIVSTVKNPRHGRSIVTPKYCPFRHRVPPPMRQHQLVQNTYTHQQPPLLLNHDEINTRLVRLLGVRPEPEPLQHALARDGALGRGEVRGHGDAEVGVVVGQLGEALVGVDVERDEGLPDDGVGRRVDDARVHRPRVRDRQERLHFHHLARRELLHLLRVVLEDRAPAEAQVAWGLSGQSTQVSPLDTAPPVFFSLTLG